jgi:hypothetical protein
MEFFSKPPWRLKHVPLDPANPPDHDAKEIGMYRDLNIRYTAPIFHKGLDVGLNIYDGEIVLYYPVIYNLESADDINLYRMEEHFDKLVPTIRAPTLKLCFSYEIAHKGIYTPKINNFLHASIKDIDVFLDGSSVLATYHDWFRIFDMYVMTPGTDADKTLAVATLFISPIKILKLKQRFGLLGHEEISDENIADLI